MRQTACLVVNPFQIKASMTVTLICTTKIKWLGYGSVSKECLRKNNSVALQTHCSVITCKFID